MMKDLTVVHPYCSVTTKLCLVPALSIILSPSMQSTDGTAYPTPKTSSDETANQHHKSQEKLGVNTCSHNDVVYLLPVASSRQNNDVSVVIECQEINLSTVDQDHQVCQYHYRCCPSEHDVHSGYWSC